MKFDKEMVEAIKEIREMDDQALAKCILVSVTTDAIVEEMDGREFKIALAKELGLLVSTGTITQERAEKVIRMIFDKIIELTK